jgi:DNA-binding MarR family transcriptional regulator
VVRLIASLLDRNLFDGYIGNNQFCNHQGPLEMITDGFDLEAFLPYRLNRAAEAISLRFLALYKEKYELSRPEWRVLAALGSAGPLTATAIGQHSAMHKTKVSRAVFALEQRRWLKRTADADDRRLERLALTAIGTRTYRGMIKLARSFEDDLLTLLQQDNLLALEAGLTAIESAIKPPSKPPNGRLSE